MSRAIGPGAFVAVVGPSGAGKDTLLDYARGRTPGVTFVRRTITRPPGVGEDCDQVSPAEFAERESAGGFAASWRAHGLAYGVPLVVDELIRGDGVAVANISRSVLDTLAGRYHRFLVVRVTASAPIRAARLAGRGRETEDSILERLGRADPAPERAADLEIVNDGAVADAGDLLVRFLLASA